jgi:hypothetical protein
MTDICTVETGLLKKKPCGEPAVSKCANCEQPLCAKHRVPQTSAGKRTGGFLCPECARAWRESEKRLGDLPETPASALPPQAEKPVAAKPSPVPRAPPAAQKKPAPPPVEESGPLEFTPEPKKPEDQK